jgi:hypothetical protein
LVVVPLMNDPREVLIEAEDYDRLKQLGLTSCWRMTRPGTRYEMPIVTVARRSITVARLVMECGDGEEARYRSRNRPNLTKANLRRVRSRTAMHDDTAVGVSRAMDAMRKRIARACPQEKLRRALADLGA